MWVRLWFFISLIWLTQNVVFGIPGSCANYIYPLTNNENTYPYTGTETPYNLVHINTETTMTIPNCKPMQIWMLNKHGAQYPNEYMLRQIVNFTSKMRHNFLYLMRKIYSGQPMESIPLYARIQKNWQTCPEFVNGRATNLSSRGKKDMVSLGERIRAKLATLFNEDVRKSFKFRSTATEHTAASMLSFINGAFNQGYKLHKPKKFESWNVTQYLTMKSFDGASSDTVLKFEIVPAIHDTLLKLYANCETWNNFDNKEVQAFATTEMAKIFDDVFRDLQLPSEYNKNVMATIYNTCRYERAVCPDKPSPWCDVFTIDEMKALEYQYDLSSYYFVGPGRQINRQLGCHPIRDMLQHFTKLERANSDEPRGVFYFAESQMLSLFLTALGVGEDSVPLTAANYRYSGNRSWRISRLVPSSANFAAVFHRCYSNDNPFKVTFYLNENPLPLEGCENGVCNWTQLKKKLGEIANKCSTRVCQEKFFPNFELFGIH